MTTARPLTAEELNDLATRAAAAVSMGLQAADDTQARMLATITQLAEQYSELHRQNGLLRGERDQACEELAAMREGAGETVAVPRATLDKLVQVAQHVSLGRGAAFIAPYPDATARYALGELHEVGLRREAKGSGGDERE